MNAVKTFDDFKEILKSYEFKTFSKFNVYQNPKGFLDENREISADKKLHWKDGLPYFHFGSRIYTCHQGKDKNLKKKLKYLEKKHEKARSNHIFQHTYVLTTKKLDCPASIKITRVYALPQFKLEDPTHSKKNVISAKIRSKIRNKEDLEGEEVFWFTLPSVDAHKNHEQGEIPAVAEPVDPAVHSKIKEFVREGIRNASVISKLLEIFVSTDLKQNDKKRSCFYPDIPTIKRIIKEDKRDICNRHPHPIDQDHGCDDHNVIPLENDEKIAGAVVDGMLEKRGNKRRKLINECNSHMENLGSILCMLPQSALLDLKKDLLNLEKKMQNRVNLNDSSAQ